jgi:hypothetical protein
VSFRATHPPHDRQRSACDKSKRGERGMVGVEAGNAPSMRFFSVTDILATLAGISNTFESMDCTFTCCCVCREGE